MKTSPEYFALITRKEIYSAESSELDLYYFDPIYGDPRKNKATTEECIAERQGEIDPGDRSSCEPLDPAMPEASYSPWTFRL